MIMLVGDVQKESEGEGLKRAKSDKKILGAVGLSLGFHWLLFTILDTNQINHKLYLNCAFPPGSPHSKKQQIFVYWVTFAFTAF